MVRVCIAILLLVLLVPSVAQAQQSAAPKRVVVLYWYNKDFPGNVLFDQSFKAVLQSAKISNFEYYPEYLESNRFPGEAQETLLRDYLRQKYAGRPIDVVVGVSDASTDFLLKYRKDLFPSSPLVFVGIKKPPADQLAAGAGITGILPASTHKQTVDLALSLHPDTQQLFFVSGTPERDKRFETVARRELQGYENKLKITYLTDLPLGQLIATTKTLPERSIVLYGWQQSLNNQGELLETWETLDQFAPSTSSPIYGMGSINVGHGIVGGYVADSSTSGTAIGQLVVRILKGERAKDIPVALAPSLAMFDWRQFGRWGINENSLPPGSVVRFKELTFWQQYKWRVIGVLTLFALQSAFIGLLLVERRRTRRAKDALDQLNAELEQRIAARTAALASKSRELETFAYSVAHDLKAPLRGIDGYSRLLLEEHANELDDEGRRFLNTIKTSSREMDQLIEDLLDYSRLERRELKTERIELLSLVNNVVGQTEREAAGRDIEVIVNVNGGSVIGDVNGLTQALKNYLDNAIKFTSEVPQPRIEIGSDATAEKCLLWVRDNGVGFDMKYGDRIFEIFQRLNRSEDYPGTGVGLAIVKKAMERMGGRAWGESEPGKGATFYLEIPKSADTI